MRTLIRICNFNLFYAIFIKQTIDSIYNISIRELILMGLARSIATIATKSTHSWIMMICAYALLPKVDVLLHTAFIHPSDLQICGVQCQRIGCLFYI